MLGTTQHRVQLPNRVQSSARTWRPILDGVSQEQAFDVVEAISRHLDAISAEGVKDASLASGSAGLAIFHAYLANAQHRYDEETKAVKLLDHAAAAMTAGPVRPSLYSGLAGLGWAAEHLHVQCGIPGTDEIPAEVDAVLQEHLSQARWPDDYDLIEGLVGFGVYALERLPQPAAVDCLERVVRHLEQTAEHRPDGITWRTDPAWLPPETRQKFPCGYYNLGLAHGVPGVIALLGRACAAGVAVATARPLLDGAVRWLLAQQAASPEGFAGWVNPAAPEQDRPTRLAWCYGDPGVAAALLLAARCVHEPAWDHEALAIAHRAARRLPEQAGVVDAGLCHGAAGLGHLFNRMYQATGEPRLAEVARFWFRRTLELRHPDRGIAGYAAFMPEREGEERWVNDPGILSGAAGIALALLAAATPVEPAWDRILLVSIPPKQSPLSAP
jgi:lantibiotic modifying enzyme